MKLCSNEETYCVHIFLGVMLFFNLEIKIKYTTKLVCHRNFSKTSQQNFILHM